MGDGSANDLTRPQRRVQDRIGRPLAEVLRELYLDRGMTLAEVGAEVGRLARLSPLAASTVSRWMEQLDIERRFPGQQAPAAAEAAL